MNGGVIGRAKTVLVFGDGPAAKAVVSAVLVRITPAPTSAEPEYEGVVTIADDTRQHLAAVVVPLADAIGSALCAPRVRYSVSAVNIGAASVMNTGVQVSGFSADVPIFLAMLSARLQMPIPQDVVSTGHIASLEGDIRWVRQVPAKVAAALQDGSIRTFLYPLLREDTSLAALAPREKEQAESALHAAKARIDVTSVGAVDELIAAVFSDDAIARGSLDAGFLMARANSAHMTGTVRAAVDHLGQGNPVRLFQLLDHLLLVGDITEAQVLLKAWEAYFVARRQYPAGDGRRLYGLWLSIPPDIRRKFAAPLIDVETTVALGQFAGKADHEDLKCLYRLTELHISESGANRAPAISGEPVEAASGAALVNRVLAEIDRDSLTARIGLGIDTARASFILQSVTVPNNGEFMDTITAFYAHLLRHTGTIDGAADASGVGAEAMALLDRAFPGEHGFEAALNEALNATHGGLRYVLDAITERYKREKEEAHVSYVLAHAVDPVKWETKVEFMRALLNRLAGVLPPDINPETPERYAKNCDIVARAYVNSMEKVTTLLRSM